MVDAARITVSTFFQGSTGGTATENVLLANFLQPRLAPPLLDGVVFLYNEQPIPEMAHIEPAGIETPDGVPLRVQRLMRQSGAIGEGG